MFGRGPRWGSKINIMFSFFRALFARTTCRFVVSLCQSTFYQPIFKMYKKIFPREGSACHFFFHNTCVQNTQTHKIITSLMKPAFCIYTISHTLVFVQKKKKNAQNLKKKNKKKTMQYTAMSVPFLSFLYIS